MFTPRLLREASRVALRQAAKLVRKLERHAEEGTPVDLQRCFYAFTMDTFAFVAFGTELETQTQGSHEFSDAFDSCQRYCNQRFSSPLWPLAKLLQWGEVRLLYV